MQRTSVEVVELAKPKKVRAKSQHPARIYAYKAKVPHENLPLVSDQMHAAHVYANRLIELERARRQAVDAAISSQFPACAALDVRYRAAQERTEGLVKAIAGRNQAARSRVAKDPDRVALREARADCKAIYAQLKAAREVAFADPTLKRTLAAIDADSLEQSKIARKECGLYWGTYCLVENARRGDRAGPPPKFRRWDGEGSVAVQLQKGLSWEAALACDDTRLRIHVLPPGPDADPRSARSRKKSRAEIWMRSGSTDDGKPVWAKFLIHLHRRPPEGTRIKWAYLHRTRVGQSSRWEFQLVLERDEWPSRIAPGGICGVDINWRVFPQGLRMATVIGDDGQAFDLFLPNDVLAIWGKVEDLQSIRDKNFNVARDALTSWVAGRDLPEWLKERLVFLGRWRSTERLSRVVWMWKDHRFAGDEDIYKTMESWRKRNRHLQDWEGASSRTASRRRDELYRRFAARLAYTYKRVVIEDVNWKDIKAVPGPEAEDPSIAARAYQQPAAPGKLAECIREAVEVVIEAPAENTTLRCHSCGHVNKFDAKSAAIQACSGCGESWDQDVNAAKNLRDFGRERQGG